MILRISKFLILVAGLLATAGQSAWADAPQVLARFQMLEPANATYYVKLSGNLLADPWWMKANVWPAGADHDPALQLKAGAFSPWFDVNLLVPAGHTLSGRRSRSGGVAEFPDVEAEFVAKPEAPRRKVVIELATAADEAHIVKRFTQEFPTSHLRFAVSADLAKDAADLETSDEMAARHLGWAREISGGTVHSPKQLTVVTGLSSQDRPDLDAKEAEVLHLLGFNTLFGAVPSILDSFGFDAMEHLNANIGLDATREGMHAEVGKAFPASAMKDRRLRGIGFLDEVQSARFGAASAPVLAAFRQWLAEHKVTPEFLGVKSLEDVKPMDTPKDFARGGQLSDVSNKRLFYLSCRYRQEKTNEHLQWLSEETHGLFGKDIWTQTLPADHPFLGCTGLGYCKSDDWGESLACDWFDLARRPAVDMPGVEDWMGLQYMYGPAYTWEGFQLLSYMSDIMRSGARSAGRDEIPVMAWITPSNETNVRLKTSSCLAHGVKNFYFWNYGPTCVSTENYWSDLKSEYSGIAALTRELAEGEDLLVPGRQRPTRLALLYSVSSDIMQPYGYISMLERRLTYFSLTHDQYPLDMLSEQDVEAGRLAKYDALYVTDPCITAAAMSKISAWVQAGGCIYGAAGAGSRNEYDEPVDGLSEVFGLEPGATFSTTFSSARRGDLNGILFADEVHEQGKMRAVDFGAIGLMGSVKARSSAEVTGTFKDGRPAIIRNHFGKGNACYIATCPAISYAKDAHYVLDDLKEKWPEAQRSVINAMADKACIVRPVELSSPVVETGLYDSPQGLAVVLANYTYETISELQVAVRQADGVTSVTSVAHGALPFHVEKGILRFTVPLALNDLILLRRTLPH